jgi:hypothetical protein
MCTSHNCCLPRDSCRYVDSLDQYGFTPLHHATWRDQRQAMIVLVNLNANLIARTLRQHDEGTAPAGSTPLHIACVIGCRDRVKLLLRAYVGTVWVWCSVGHDIWHSRHYSRSRLNPNTCPPAHS